MDSKKTGALISALRREKGMTQKELAAQLHVSDRTVSKWERGAGFPDVSLMMQLADCLGISVNELLQGERKTVRSFCAETESEVRDAVLSMDRHTRAKEKQMHRKLLAGGLILVLVVLSAWRLVYTLGKTQILFPPRIHCEILQAETELGATLLVDRSNSGLYDYVCAYEMDTYGEVSLRERKLWQSYTDVVEEEIYQTLQKLHAGSLTAVDRLTQGGFLARYDESPAVCTLIETDEAGKPVFSYKIDAGRYTAACETALVTARKLYVISYNSAEDCLYITTVDKGSGAETVSAFSDGDWGGILFDRTRMWVQDDVLYFAETDYGESGYRAIFGLFDLQLQQARTVWSVPRAQVVMVRHDTENAAVSVVINPMSYAPLKLVTLDDRTLERLDSVQLALPHEYLVRKDSVYAAESYLLFEGDMDAQYAALLFDVTDRGQAASGIRNDVLAVYEVRTGKMIWRGKFEMDSDYDICEVQLENAFADLDSLIATGKPA